MHVSDFDYPLPERLIAHYPARPRSHSRLLELAPDAALHDRRMTEFAGLLNAGDLLVFNNTRVIPARLLGRKASGGKVEVLVERLLAGQRVLAQVRASKAPQPGSRLLLGETAEIKVEVRARRDDFFELEFATQAPLVEVLDRYGHVPLPPYIQRADQHSDRDDYQTLWALHPGAVAAPTAGLHFDRDLLQALRERGVESAFVTLHVGAGTFQPLRSARLQDHVMHAEQVEVDAAVCAAVAAARQRGARVVAVGTTVVRSLESAAQQHGGLAPMRDDTRLFITPGFRFRVVDALLTNFHLPKSTLLMLVSAFAGHAPVMAAYRHAVEQQYRFFSYGDAMFVQRREEPL